jgi:hypothetical protein
MSNFSFKPIKPKTFTESEKAELKDFNNQVGHVWSNSIKTLYPNMHSVFLGRLQNIGYKSLQDFLNNELLTEKNILSKPHVVNEPINAILSKIVDYSFSNEFKVFNEDDDKLFGKMLLILVEAFFIVANRYIEITKEDITKLTDIFKNIDYIKSAEWYSPDVDIIFENLLAVLRRLPRNSSKLFCDIPNSELKLHGHSLFIIGVIESSSNFEDVLFEYPSNTDQIIINKRKKSQFIYFLSFLTDQLSISLTADMLRKLSSSFKNERVSKLNEYIRDVENKKRKAQLPLKNAYQKIKLIFD